MDTKPIRGPRTLEYVPPFAREIPGIEHVTTVAQLVRLKTYFELPPASRQPFLRLGCSVSHRSSEQDMQNSTWVVTCNGSVEVLRRNGDPRSAYKWFKNKARPWNVTRDFQSGTSTDEKTRDPFSSVSANYIVTVAVDQIPEDMTVAELQPDGRVIISTRYRVLSAKEGLIEVLVNGVEGWWKDHKFDGLFFTLREANGEIYANQDGAVWVSLQECVNFPTFGFADGEAMADRRAAAPDLLLFLKARARHYLMSRLNPYDRSPVEGSAIIKAIDEAIADQDLCTITLPAMDALVPVIKMRLSRAAA